MKHSKYIVTFVALVAVVGFLAAESWAGCGNCGPAKKCSAAKSCVAGTVKSACTSSGKIVLTTGKREAAKDVAIKVCPKAKITIDGKTATLCAIKAGSAAKVCTVKAKCGSLVATRVAVGGDCCPKK